MIEQLMKKDCKTGTYENMFPITVLSAIKNEYTGETLDVQLESYNHIYLPFIENSKAATRKQIPERYRRKGLWITYISCQNNVVTEYYNNDDLSDTAWGNCDNWVPYIDKRMIEAIVKHLLSWYKA